MNTILNKQFISLDNQHSFSISIIEDTCYFSIEKLENKYYKTFLLLLKSCFEYMLSNNVKYVKQYINIDDIEFFKNSDIIQENTDIIVKTNINNFLEEICNALDIKRL